MHGQYLHRRILLSNAIAYPTIACGSYSATGDVQHADDFQIRSLDDCYGRPLHVFGRARSEIILTKRLSYHHPTLYFFRSLPRGILLPKQVH